jgi:hypothetical protein
MIHSDSDNNTHKDNDTHFDDNSIVTFAVDDFNKDVLTFIGVCMIDPSATTVLIIVFSLLLIR